jgi:hypothetical protein
VHDMREILLKARADAPPASHTVDDIVAAGRRRRRRALVQRVGGAGVAAAAVATVAVLVAVNLAVPSPNRGANAVVPAATPSVPATPTPSPPFTFTFGGYQVGEYRVMGPHGVTPDYQTAGVMRDVKEADGKVNPHYVATLTVYQPGRFNPEKVRTGTKLTVQGRDAFQAEAQEEVYGGVYSNGPSQPATLYRDGTQTVTTTALAWQYAPDSWAVLKTEANRGTTLALFPPADMLKVVERFAVSPGAPVVAKLPFRVGYLPDGFSLQEINGQSMTAEHTGMSTFIFSKQPAATGPLTGPRSLEHLNSVTSVVISILWVDTPPPDAVKRTSRCNPGQHWCMTTLPGGEFYAAIEDPSKTMSDEELLKFADGLTFATVKDASTWFPAT